EAVAARHRSPATAEAEPPEEPPGVRSALEAEDFHGLTTLPNAEVSLDEPMANSSMLSLPSITAPSRQRLAVTVDSYSGLKPSRMWPAAWVCPPLVAKRSFTPSGIPSSGPASPRAILSALALAMSRACSGVVTTEALSLGLAASMAPI